MSEASKKPRVLALAEAANPQMVSVPLIGWSLSQALKEVADVHLVTQVRNRAALLDAGLIEGEDFTAIDTEAVIKPVYKLATFLRGGSGKSWTTATAAAALAYPYFEHKVWKHFKDDLKQGRFDLVHRLTPMSPTSPSRIARPLANLGVPFVLGPINGGVAWPAGYEDRRRKEREWLSYVRGVYKLLPGYRSTRKHAGAIICGSQATLEQMPAFCRDRCLYLPENAIDPARFARRRERAAATPIRLVFVGRLVPYKCPDLLIQAAAEQAKAGKVQITLVGDGPMRGQLEAQVRDLGIEDAVEFAGWMEHTKVQDTLAGSDVLVLPSIREFGGGVVLEAMAVGLAVVVADYAGPAELVTEQTGWKVPMADSGQLVAGLSAVLDELIDRPEKIDECGRNALRRAEAHFTWSAKARQLAQVYRWCQGGPRPTFGFDSLSDPTDPISPTPALPGPAAVGR